MNQNYYKKKKSSQKLNKQVSLSQRLIFRNPTFRPMTRFSRQILARLISNISSSRLLLLVKFQTYFEPTFACRELNALMNTSRFARVATRRSASLESRQRDARVHRDTVPRRRVSHKPLDNLSCLPRCAPPRAKSNRPLD